MWLAHDDVLDRQVAVKVLADNWSRDPDVHRRFLSEARVLLDAESPRITRGYELGESTDGHPYLVMTWADRGTLAERIAARSRAGEVFAPHEAAAIVRQVALALVDVHALGHLHRDVKPSNVLIRSASDVAPIPGIAQDEQLMIGDFGLARGIDASAITMVAGSPGYVAPEQAGGLTQLDVRADLYPLGRILLELMSGDPGGRATTMAAAATEDIDAAGVLAEAGVAIPPGLVDLIDELLAFDREDRPATAAEVAARLDAFTDADATPTGVAGIRRPPPTRTTRRRVGAVAALLVVALGALVAGAAARPLARRDVDDHQRRLRPVGGGTGDPELPPGAALDDRASDDTRTVANVALPVADVVEFYESPPAPWEVVEGPATFGRLHGHRAGGAVAAGVTVTVSPAAVTVGKGISRIVIAYE